MATITQEAAKQNVLAALEKAGGKLFNTDEVLFSGNQLLLPEGTTIDDNITFLRRKKQELEEVIEFRREYVYRPWDMAYSLHKMMKRVFGGVVHKGQLFNPASLMDVKVGVGEVVQVPWGQFVIPLLPSVTFSASSARHPEHGLVGVLYAEGPRSASFAIQGVFNLVGEELQEGSIYKGKAIDGQEMPDFIDFSSVDESRLVYSTQAKADMRANLFGPIVRTEATRRAGLPLKRTVLLKGPFGTGKTEALKLTGKKAVEAPTPWTFILVRPGRDSIEDAMRTARLYAPSVVAFEDIDTVANASEEAERISTMLDLFDGMDAKGQDIMVVLTTNYAESLHKGMLRPGRLDAIIHIGELDAKGVEQLIRNTIPAEQLADEIDWAEVHKAFEGYLPAFVVEAAGRAVRYTIFPEDDEASDVIGTDELVFAGNGMRDHFELMQGAKTEVAKPTLDTAVTRAVEVAITNRLDSRILRDHDEG